MWNYRIMKHEDKVENRVWYGLHEIYYSEDGKVHSWTVKPDEVGDTPSEIFSSIIMKGKDVWKYRHAILDYDMEPECTWDEEEKMDIQKADKYLHNLQSENNDSEEMMVYCTCHNKTGYLQFFYEDEKYAWEHGNEVEISFLIPYVKFWRRVKNAFQYIFGTDKYIYQTNIYASYTDVKRIIYYLQRFVDEQRDFTIKQMKKQEKENDE
jgi:hypothetical protein